MEHIPIESRFEVLLTILAIVAALGLVADRLRLPFPIFLTIAGGVLGMIPQLPDIEMSPNIVFMVFLPPLLYGSAWSFPWEDFRAFLNPILLMAIGLTLVTTIVVGFLGPFLIAGLPLAAAFVLGAIIAPPDAVAAAAVTKGLRLPKSITTILEGESLVNDAAALVAYQFAVAAVVTGMFSLRQASIDFVTAALGGVLIGLVLGFGLNRLHRVVRDPSVEITISLLTPYAAYLPAEHFGCSGVLAVVTAALYLGSRSSQSFLPESRLLGRAVWSMVSYVLNSLVFIMIGLELPSILEGLRGFSAWQLAAYGAGVCLLVIAIRFACVFGYIELAQRFIPAWRTRDRAENRKEGAVLSWAGMRGVVSLAAALAIPLHTHAGQAFPMRELILFLTFCVIIATLVVQGLTLPVIIKRLGLRITDTDLEQEMRARRRILELAIEDLQTRIDSTGKGEARDSLKFIRDRLEQQLDYLSKGRDLEEDREREGKITEVHLEVIEHVRRALHAMFARGELSPEAFKRIEFDLDSEEHRLKVRRFAL